MLVLVRETRSFEETGGHKRFRGPLIQVVQPFQDSGFDTEATDEAMIKFGELEPTFG